MNVILDRQTEKERVEVTYNELCGIAMYHLYVRSRQHDNICLLGFDCTNKEHLFLYHVALGLAGTMQSRVVCQTSFWDARKFNKNIKDKNFKMTRAKRRDRAHGVKTKQLLEELRDAAKEKLVDEFTFADIYECFYEGRKQ